jgi:hypothetical protein
MGGDTGHRVPGLLLMPRNGNTTARGYGSDHQAERRKWEPAVATGHILCHADICKLVRQTGDPQARLIDPDQDWDLGHDHVTGQWRGPEHRACNRADGARRGNRGRGGARIPRHPPAPIAPLRTSRRW